MLDEYDKHGFEANQEPGIHAPEPVGPESVLGAWIPGKIYLEICFGKSYTKHPQLEQKLFSPYELLMKLGIIGPCLFSWSGLLSPE